MPALVQHEVRETKNVTRQVAARAPEDGLDARNHLGQAERLRHVVVSARAKRVDLVLDAVLRCQKEDRPLEPLLTQAPADLDPLDIGQHPVEDDQVGLELADDAEGIPPGACLPHLESLVTKGRCHRVDDRPFVVDDEDSTSTGPVRSLLSSVHPPSVPPLPVNHLRKSPGAGVKEM